MTVSMEALQRGRLRPVAMAAIALLVGGIGLLWAWNSVGVELFALPEARFRHVVAAEVGILALAWIFQAGRSAAGAFVHAQDQ
jgi:hypothetical protein